MWGATFGYYDWSTDDEVSIHAPRVGRDLADRLLATIRQVSIHAPRVGRDDFHAVADWRRSSFNPRAPCGARRHPRQGRRRLQKFQSTRPVWGATNGFISWHQDNEVSIHAPRVGRDSTSAKS